MQTHDARGLQLRRKIPIDFQSDANLDKARGAPGHFHLLVRILPMALLPLHADPAQRTLL